MGRGFGALYLWLVEHQLLKYREPAAHVSMVSEAGWTLVQVPSGATPIGVPAVPEVHHRTTRAEPVDPQIALLSELKSGNAPRVTAALARTTAMGRIHVADKRVTVFDHDLPATRQIRASD